MLLSFPDAQPDRSGLDLAYRGYCPVYRENAVNNCPGCGRTHWLVGRMSAECGFCATALPLSENSVRMNGRHTRDNRPMFSRSSHA